MTFKNLGVLSVFLALPLAAQWQSVASGDSALNTILDAKPTLTTGSGAPAANCTAMHDLYVSSTGGVYGCLTTNTWTLVALLPSNNLSDLTNTATARTNLGLGSAATQASSAFVPVTGISAGTCVPNLFPSTGTIAQYNLVTIGSTGVAGTAGTSGGGVFGVAQASATGGANVPVCFLGTSNIVMDGTTLVGDLSITSVVTGGYGHDSGQMSRNNVGLEAGVSGTVTTGCTGSPCTALVDLEGANRTGRQILSSYLPTWIVPSGISVNASGNTSGATGDVQATETDTFLPNSSSTGTTLNYIARTVMTAGVLQFQNVATASNPPTGIVVAGAGTTGSAQVRMLGQAACVFDGATAAGHWVGASSITPGQCTDLGTATFASITASWAVGLVESTNASAGTYPVLISIRAGPSTSMVYPGAGVPNSTGSAWGTSYAVGTAANDLVQLTGSGFLPALNASLLNNFPTLNQSTTGAAGSVTGETFPGSGVIVGTTDTQTLANKSIATTELTGALQAAQEPAHTGDVTNTAGSLAMTVGKINGTALSGLATGILKNTTITGVPSIAVAGTDYAAPNSNTTGNAATATALAATPTLCTTGQAPTGILASGNATGCASPGTGPTGATGPGYTATSTTSLTVATGSQTLTTQSGLAYSAGAIVQIVSSASTANYMIGNVTSYSGTTMVVAVTFIQGSGTIAAWNINLSGIQPNLGVLITYSANHTISASDCGNFPTASASLTFTFPSTLSPPCSLGIVSTSASAVISTAVSGTTINLVSTGLPSFAVCATGVCPGGTFAMNAAGSNWAEYAGPTGATGAQGTAGTGGAMSGGYFPWGDCSYCGSQALVGSATKYVVSMAIPSWGQLSIKHIVIKIGTGCASCGVAGGIYDTTPTSVLCPLTTAYGGGTPNMNTTGFASIGFAAGTDVAAGVCTLPNLSSGAYHLLITTDSSAFAIEMGNGSESGYMNQNASVAYGSTSAAIATGSGSTLAVPSPLSGVTWGAFNPSGSPFVVYFDTN